MSEVDLRGLFVRYIEVLNSHQFERLDGFLHERLKVNGREVGRDEVIASLRVQIDAMPDFSWGLKDLVVEGNRVAALAVNKGTPRRAWFGTEPSGDSVEYAGVAFHTVEDGRFSEQWYVVDALAARAQLGGGA